MCQDQQAIVAHDVSSTSDSWHHSRMLRRMQLDFLFRRLHITERPPKATPQHNPRRLAAGVSHDLLRDLAVSLDHDLVDLDRCLDGLRLVVDPLELLECTALGFDTVRRD